VLEAVQEGWLEYRRSNFHQTDYGNVFVKR
jgi:hypothetical protein